MDVMRAADMNNEALQLESEGDYAGAEKLHLAALDLKRKSSNATPSEVSVSENGLAELYMKMGKLDKVEELLLSAYHNRSYCDNFDKSCTADNMGRYYEMRGNTIKAVEWRKANGPDRMICSYDDCPKSKRCLFSKLKQLKKCGRCKCVFYCDANCQQQDWDRHRPFCTAA